MESRHGTDKKRTGPSLTQCRNEGQGSQHNAGRSTAVRRIAIAEKFSKTSRDAANGGSATCA
eukprot:5892940-Pleurochrysis_carterae.AAC.2